jgi:hypothetical protein
MRELNICEMDLVSGADASSDFNQCMADNWAENTIVGGVGGAIAGGVTGAGVLSLPGAVTGGILGAVGGSTGTGVFCALTAIF